MGIALEQNDQRGRRACKDENTVDKNETIPQASELARQKSVLGE